MTPRGTHLLIECRECRADVLNDPETLEQALRAAAASIGATVLRAAFHHFEPHGVTGVLLLSESHVSIHSWPEHGYAAVDLFTCGPHDPRLALPILQAALGGRLQPRSIQRGLESDP